LRVRRVDQPLGFLEREEVELLRRHLHADARQNARYTGQMAAPTTDDLLAAIRRLPLDERLRLIEQAAHEAAEDTPKPAAVSTSPAHSLLGLMADDPDLVDRMCSIAYEARKTARMRAVDE
jgi:hypothetical protein